MNGMSQVPVEFGPGAEEATARLQALHPSLRAEVRRVVNGSRPDHDDPVLAAAVVATARRTLAHIPRFAAIGVLIALVLAAIMGVSVPPSQWCFAPVAFFGVMLVVGFQVVTTRRAARRAIDRNLQILQWHGGAVPPATPVDNPEFRKRILAGEAGGFIALAIVLGGTTAISAAVSYSDHRVGQVLRERGVEATAEVIRFDPGDDRSSGFAGARWDVRFAVGDRSVRTRIVTDDLQGEAGQSVPIVYDPARPEVARHADDLAARSDDVWVVGAVCAGVAALVGAPAYVLRRRYRRASTASS